MLFIHFCFPLEVPERLALNPWVKAQALEPWVLGANSGATTSEPRRFGP